MTFDIKKEEARYQQNPTMQNMNFFNQNKPQGQTQGQGQAQTTNTFFSNTSGSTNTSSPFNFGQKQGNTSGSLFSNAFSSNTANQTQIQPPTIPQEIKDKTVKELMDTLESQLEQQVSAFQTRAKQIARWDRMIFECIELTQYLEEQIKKTEAAQKELQQSASSLLNEQDQFIETIKKKGLEKIPQSGDQRQKLYRLAHHLGDKFLDMEIQLKEMIDHIENQAQAESSSDIEKITKITNCHYNSMRWIVGQCESIDKKIDELTKRLPEGLL